MKRFVFVFFFCLTGTGYLTAQVGISKDSDDPESSAMLDVRSLNTGILFPRMTTSQRNALPSPARGLLIYNLTTQYFNFYNGSHWYQAEQQFVTSTIGTVSPGGGISINTTGNPPHQSAILDISNTTRGVLLPRSAPDAVPLPANGLILFDTTSNLIKFFNGTAWRSVCATTTGIAGVSGSQVATGLSISQDVSVTPGCAILQVKSASKGLLIPRLSDQMRDLLLPVEGLTIYNTTSGSIQFYTPSGWYKLDDAFLAQPVAGVHIPYTVNITWNWNAVAGATGYKWNTVNDITTATDIGNVTTKIETGLQCGGTYTRYLWVYNTCGHSSPATLTQATINCWVCGTQVIDDRDGKVYNTIQVGTQCWMVENMNVGNMVTLSSSQTNNSIIEKYCYNNQESYCDVYGGMYTWNELMDYSPASSTTPSGRRGICPIYFHVPSSNEICVMAKYLDPAVTCGSQWSGVTGGGKMKETGYEHWYSPNTGATNASGLAFRGAGRVINGAWDGLKYSAIIPSTTENSVWYHAYYLSNVRATIYKTVSESKANGNALRCLAD